MNDALMRIADKAERIAVALEKIVKEEYEDVPDRFLGEEGVTWSVRRIHAGGSGTRLDKTELVGTFNTLAEAEAAIVGLEFAIPFEVRHGDFSIDGPIYPEGDPRIGR